MNWLTGHILSAIIFIPMLGALILLILEQKSERAIRVISLLTMLLGFALSVWLFLIFDGSNPDFQLVERHPWIPGWDIHYQVGIDGISLLLVMLTALLGPVVILSSWTQIKERVKEYHLFLLLLQTGMLGTFLSLDMILFYVFWELMLIPMYFLIGVWGGPRKIYAAVKFFLFTMFGSVLMLVAILWLFLRTGSFDYIMINAHLSGEKLRLLAQLPLFGAFALAFAIKVPMFPLHTWLPDAHVEAPTAGSVILAGVLLKMGTYGFIRFAIPFFPDAVASLSPYFYLLAVIGIIYGALVSMAQEDIKKLVAYSSVSHLGFVILGLFAFTPLSLQGSLIQMVNHGLSTGALFLLVGIIYERAHKRQISDFGGIAKKMPIYSALFLIVALSSIGLPGLNGFVGEFLILVGTYVSRNPYSKLSAILAGTGVIFAAVYLLWMYQRVFFGPLTKEENKTLKDLNLREFIYLGVIIIFIVWIGVYPSTFLKKSEATINNLISQVQSKRLAESRLKPEFARLESNSTAGGELAKKGNP